MGAAGNAGGAGAGDGGVGGVGGYADCGWWAGSCSFILSTAYVCSLYVWACPHPRDHPSTIKKRFLSAAIMTFISPLFLWLCLSNDALRDISLLEYMGLRIPGLIQAIILPLFLTIILYLGPLAMYTISGVWKVYKEPMYWWNNFNDLIWVRNHIVAPLSEEFTYRACMMPILLQCLSPVTAIIICPFFFGIAHFHHMIEKLRNGHSLILTIRDSCFQFTYTTLFGAYSAFLFARTGHFAAPFVAHMFCNHMGFPNFGAIFLYRPMQSLIISVLFVIGFIMWNVLLVPLTNPSFYHNNIYWHE
ncbi:ras converting CAAX endopeptidase Sras [Arctopsyche grandis]|uniref:ras converting CAAX endopeptidase Sras n=1 Tax=Arctopsyche grandis TaxID=121162 RepID=UPI00406D910B